MPEEQSPESSLGHQLLMQARFRADNEANPFLRSRMHAAELLGGSVLRDYAEIYGSYSCIREVDYDDPDVYSPLWQKIFAGKELASALACNGRFDEALDLAKDVSRLNRFNGVEAIGSIIRCGYYGANGELLELFPTNYLDITEAEDPSSKRKFYVTEWLEALAESGIDITEPNTPYSQLFQSLSRSESDRSSRQERLKNFAIAFAKSGNAGAALGIALRLSLHEQMGAALLSIGEYFETIEDQNDLFEYIKLANKYFGVCGTQRDHVCTDDNQFNLGLAYLYARRGKADHARELLGLADQRYFPREFLKVHCELYKRQGLEPDRGAALRSLSKLKSSNTSQLTPFIRAIVEEDLASGRSIPSLIWDGEAVPLLAWDINSVFDPINSVDPEKAENAHYREMVEASCLKQRSNAHTELSIMMAKTNAPRSAEQFLDKIEDPVDRVRAETAVGQILISRA